MIKDQIIQDKMNRKGSSNESSYNNNDYRDAEAFTSAFKELFAKYVQEFRYRGEQRAMFCVLKAEGDILLEMRCIQGAILTYKELVS